MFLMVLYRQQMSNERWRCSWLVNWKQKTKSIRRYKCGIHWDRTRKIMWTQPLGYSLCTSHTQQMDYQISYTMIQRIFICEDFVWHSILCTMSPSMEDVMVCPERCRFFVLQSRHILWHGKRYILQYANMLVLSLDNSLIALIYRYKTYNYSNNYHKQKINTVYLQSIY